MNFNAEELKYLRHVLHRATNYTIAQGRESVARSIRHDKLIDKIKMYEDRLRYGWTNKVIPGKVSGQKHYGID